jgi:hypothetical protein
MYTLYLFVDEENDTDVIIVVDTSYDKALTQVQNITSRPVKLYNAFMINKINKSKVLYNELKIA